MSNYEQKPNTWVLFQNDKKTAENQPDYKGTATLTDGTKKQIAAWKKVSSTGNVYLSGTFSEPYNPEEKASQKTEPVKSPDCSGDLPF